MATSTDTVEYILDILQNRHIFSVRRMFGEFCLYANGKPVGFICDDTLFVKIVPASDGLLSKCDKGPCYPGSKDYYIVADDQLTIPELPNILVDIAAGIPCKHRK